MKKNLKKKADWRKSPRAGRSSRYSKSSVARLRSMYATKQEDFAKYCYLNMNIYKSIERRQHTEGLRIDKKHACKIAAMTGASLKGLLDNKLTKDDSEEELTFKDIEEFKRTFKVLELDEASLKWLSEEDQIEYKRVAQIKLLLINAVAVHLKVILERFALRKGQDFVSELLFFAQSIDETVDKYKLNGLKSKSDQSCVLKAILETIKKEVPNTHTSIQDSKTEQMRMCIERFASILLELENIE